MGLLEKISWKTRRWNLKVNLFDLYLHDGDGCWGFSLFRVSHNFNTYCLLEFVFRLPNGADRKVFQLTDWDFLFLVGPLYNWYLDVDEDIMWGREIKGLEKIGYKVLSKIIK